jgi:hypothetical protein
VGFHRELTVENGRRKIVIGMVGGNIERLYQGHDIRFTLGEGEHETEVVIILRPGVIAARKRMIEAQVQKVRRAKSAPRDAG